MSVQLFIAVALCIGSPSDGSDTRYGLHGNECDYGEMIDQGPSSLYTNGYTLDECRHQLSTMMEHGYYVKMCVPADTWLDSFHVVWDTDIVWDR